MRLDLNLHDPKSIGTLAGLAVVTTALYWIIWRRSPKIANGLVFAGLVALICQLVDWDWFLNEYFRVHWKLP